MDVPQGPITREMGHVHASGNPHYLVDPVEGLRVARLVSERLAEIRPAAAAGFRDRFQTFRRTVQERLVGPALVAKYEDVADLVERAQAGQLVSFLEERGDRALLGGWLGALAPHHGTLYVADHDLWPYFARRFGLRSLGFFEPKPGLDPTTGHLRELVDAMKKRGCRLILASPYFHPRHARFLADATQATVVLMAHQVDAIPQASTYLAMVDWNVKQIVDALSAP
jgi:zinc/manganese transport system substrate-binding protein/zinc transport system substrate-binding protein